jgi:ribosomal protein S18 acetylase RimI-like enzyme
MSFTIKQATVADAELISALSKTTFHAAFHAQNSKADMDLFLDKSFAVVDTKKELLDGNHQFFLVYDEGEEPIGYAVLREGKSFQDKPSEQVIEISRIYLLPEYKGKGAGKLLMNHCLQTAKAMGKAWVWLGVWEHNPNAIAFYQSVGFEKCGEHDFVLGTDVQKDWLMIKPL